MNRSKWSKRLGWIALALFIFLYLPTAKNVVLYTQYHHGNDTLERIYGEAGSHEGTWRGVFDAYPCGYDTRTVITLTIGANGTGTLQRTFLGARYLVGWTFLYSWSSLIPFDPHEASGTTQQVKLDGNYLIVEAEASQSAYMHDEVWWLEERATDRIHFAQVDSIGAVPRYLGYGGGQLIDGYGELVRRWHFGAAY